MNTIFNDPTNARGNTYKSVFKDDNNYIPVPLGKYVLLYFDESKYLLMVESRDKDSPEIKKVYKVGDTVTTCKSGDYVLVNMHNRPEVVYGANEEMFFMVFEHDITVRYDKMEATLLNNINIV